MDATSAVRNAILKVTIAVIILILCASDDALFSK